MLFTPASTGTSKCNNLQSSRTSRSSAQHGLCTAQHSLHTDRSDMLRGIGGTSHTIRTNMIRSCLRTASQQSSCCRPGARCIPLLSSRGIHHASIMTHASRSSRASPSAESMMTLSGMEGSMDEEEEAEEYGEQDHTGMAVAGAEVVAAAVNGSVLQLLTYHSLPSFSRPWEVGNELQSTSSGQFAGSDGVCTC